MTQLIIGQSLTKHAGTKFLFSDINIGLEDGERLALIGANGTGKSTLLGILSGQIDPDNGSVIARKHLRIGFVRQEETFSEAETVRDVLEDGLREAKTDEVLWPGLISKTLGQCAFSNKDERIAALSGGWRKRLSIARELVKEPELLLLDEPTNHLDIDGVLWLEELLLEAQFGVLFVSHDRYLIESLATRVIELGKSYPEGFFESKGTYSDFLEKRAAFLISRKQAQETLENKIRREVAWLRAGVKARGTKAKGRIKKAHELIEDLSSYKSSDKKTGIQFSGTGRRAKEILKAELISKSLGGQQLFSKISFSLSPRTCLGVVGPNGSGKTTLQKVLLGELKPDTGKIRSLLLPKYVSFDQNRDSLNKAETLREALCKDSDAIVFNGKQVHIISWARRFLFQPEQLDVVVASLSGGEQARILISRLMREEADILFLDEPTNDLDIPTLEVLEESLSEFPGAVVLTTHDRYLLDRVATHIVGLHGDGDAHVYADYSQFEQMHLKKRALKKTQNLSRAPKESRTKVQTRLSYIEQREYDGIEELILTAETELSRIKQELENPDISSNHEKVSEVWQLQSSQEKLIEDLYHRWHELSEKVKAMSMVGESN